jgi:rod shape-determining protein MreC
MTGTNGPEPALLYWAPGQPPAEGDMVLTSAEGGAFPAGLPVGVVHYDAQNDPVVLPLADLDALRVLRLFCYPSNEPVLAQVHGMAKTGRVARGTVKVQAPRVVVPAQEGGH